MTVSDPVFEPDYPWPSRFYWTKRITVWSFIILLLTAAAWMKWQHDASAATTARIAAIHARGEPILPEDFVFDKVPDEENAAEYLSQAFAAISRTVESPAQSNVEFNNYLPMTPLWIDMSRKAVAADQQALALAHKARQFSKVDWKLKFTSPLISVLLPALNDTRNLANVMGDAAMYQHLQGDDAGAIERLRDTYAEADAVARQPILVSQLVGIGIEALASQRLLVMAPGLRIADDPHPPPSTQPVNMVTRQTINELIKQLVTRANEPRINRGMLMERAFGLDVADTISGKGSLLYPMFQFDALEAIRLSDESAASMTQPSLPLSRVAAPNINLRRLPADSTQYAHVLTQMFVPSMNRASETDFRRRTECNLVAVALAARLYQIDHDGQWPASLQALAPQYLPRVPVDLLARDGRPLGYIFLNEGKRPIVYSVGPDGKDQTADGAMIPALPQVGWYFDPKLKIDDQWRDISRFDPPPPATQPQQ